MEHIRAEGSKLSVWKCPHCETKVSLLGWWRDGHSQAACELEPKESVQDRLNAIATGEEPIPEMHPDLAGEEE